MDVVEYLKNANKAAAQVAPPPLRDDTPLLSAKAARKTKDKKLDKKTGGKDPYAKAQEAAEKRAEKAHKTGDYSNIY